MNQHIQKGINPYEKSELKNYGIQITITFIIILFFVVLGQGINSIIFWPVLLTILAILSFIVKKARITFKRMYLTFDKVGYLIDDDRVRYNEIKSISTYYLHVLKDKRTRYTSWTEETYYRCFSINSEGKDIMFAYMFEESAPGIHEIYDKREINGKIDGYCEVYHNSEPYMYYFSEQDFLKIYSTLKNNKVEINTVRK